VAQNRGTVSKTGHVIAGVPVYRWDFVDYAGRESHLGYCRIADIPDEDREAFLQWMTGQTIPHVEAEETSHYNVYPQDWQTFVERVKKGKPYLWD
jgi:hypothetical protein